MESVNVQEMLHLKKLQLHFIFEKIIYGLETGINLKEIKRTSQLVSQLTGVVIQPNKAVVGKNAFAHESGIHQDGYVEKSVKHMKLLHLN